MKHKYMVNGKLRTLDFQVKDNLKCKKCKSFVPFTGNGRPICRLYELGRCPQEDNR
ncbi:MAG: hypothetical protein ACQGQO_01130 [Sphaerochaetaceae bacterium]